MTDTNRRSFDESPASISREFKPLKDSLIQTALKDDQTRRLIFYIENELQKFLRDSSMSKIQFPPTLSQYQQQLILRLSVRFGLQAMQDPLVLTKTFNSAIPRTSLEDHWKSKARSRKIANRQTKLGNDLAGEKTKPITRAPKNAKDGAAPSGKDYSQQQNDPYSSRKSYSNPYASHTPSNNGSNSRQSASYSNPYANQSATRTQFTNEDMDQWVKTNQKKKKREERKKFNKKNKAKPKNKETKREELNSKVPFFPNKPFNKKTVDSYDTGKPSRRMKQSTRRGGRSSNQSSLPQHILHLHSFDPSICRPVFKSRNSETIKQSLTVFKSAKSPRNPFYHMCWNHNTEKGCHRGNKCNWVHCYVGVMENDYEMANELLTFQNEFGADIIFVNPSVCLATFQNDRTASAARESYNESSLFKLQPYSKDMIERLSAELPPSFFSNEIESSV